MAKWSFTNSKNAFTLVELIVVTVLVVVLAGMIAPRLFGAGRSASLQAAARRVQVAAQYARDYAATHRRICRLELNPKEGRFQLVAQADPEHKPGEYQPLRGGLGRVETLNEPVRFSRVQVQPYPPSEEPATKDRRISFYPIGRSDAAVVQLTDGRRTVSVLVFPSRGRCKLIEGAADELPDDRMDLDA